MKNKVVHLIDKLVPYNCEKTYMVVSKMRKEIEIVLLSLEEVPIKQREADRLKVTALAERYFKTVKTFYSADGTIAPDQEQCLIIAPNFNIYLNYQQMKDNG